LLRGPRGEPRWPAGVVGSITHCAGYRAAAVAASTRAAAIGIDAEPDQSLPDGVLDVIAIPVELPMLRRLAASRPDVSWERMLFSAKESVFKAWYPLAGHSLDFDEAAVAFDLSGRFTARILVDAAVNVYIGRWLAVDGLVVTGIVVPAGTRAHAVGNAVHSRRL
jgi:4'-phosphopantetheinyl transferase EntD